MPDPVFIGTGRFRGFWDATANRLYDVEDDTVGTGSALSNNGNWSDNFDTECGYDAGDGPKVGDFLKVRTAGGTSIDSVTQWRVGDWLVRTSAGVWERISTSDAIASVVVGDVTTSTLADALLTGSHTRFTQQVLFVSGNCPTASFSGSNNFTYEYATDGSPPTSYSKLRLTGNLFVDGQIQAKQIHSRYITSSVLYESGSTQFGDTIDDIHRHSGSLRVYAGANPSLWTGSLEIDGDLSGNATHRVAYPVVSASRGVVTAQIGAHTDGDALAFTDGVLSGAASTRLHMPVISASTKVVTAQIGAVGDAHALAFTDGVLSGAASTRLHMPVISASTQIVTAQIGPVGDAHLLALTDGVVSGAASSKLQIPAITASHGITVPQIGPSGDNNLLGLESGELDISGTLYVYPGGKDQAELTVVSGTVSMSGSTTLGTQANGHTHRIYGDVLSTLDASGDFIITGLGSNTFRVDSTSFDWGATAGNAIGATVRDNYSAAFTLGCTGADMLQFDTTNGAERLNFGVTATGSAYTQIQVPVVSASTKVVTAQIGPVGDAHLLALSSGELVVDGNVGIGVTSPAKTLEVKAGSSGNGINLIAHDNSVAYIQLEAGSAGGYVQLHDSSNEQRIRLDSTSTSWFDGGNVGIGVTDPDETLEVAGRIHISSEVAAPSAPAGGDGGILYTKTDGLPYWISDDQAEIALTSAGGGGAIDGAGAATRLAFWSDADTLSSDANITWDGSDVLTMSGTLLLTSNTTTNHRITGSVLLKTSDEDLDSNDTGFTVAGEAGDAIAMMTVNQDNNGHLEITNASDVVTLYASNTTLTAPHADYNIDRARKVVLSGSTFMGTSGLTQTNVDIHDAWGHFYCTSGSIRIMSGASLRQDDWYGINLPNHATKLGSIRANAFPTYSSIRWKYNIEEINEPLTRINQLRGVFFDWKEGGKSDMGFIAEEVGEVLPRIVRYEDDGIHAESLDYGKIIPLCVEAIKALSAKNEALEKELDNIKKKI